MANRSKAAVLAKPNPFTTSLICIIVDEYGMEALNWDIETIKMELEDDYKVELSSDVIDKIVTGIKLLTTDEFYTSLPDFIIYANTLADDSVDHSMWSPADAYDVAWAMAEARLLSPPDEKDLLNYIDPEIIGYIIVVLRSAGCMQPPESLSFIPASELAIKDVVTASSDPELAAAGYQEELEQGIDLQYFVDSRLQQMFNEIKSIQLEHGTFDKLIAAVEGSQQKMLAERQKEEIAELFGNLKF